jgi:hypothetical protein
MNEALLAVAAILNHFEIEPVQRVSVPLVRIN